MVSPIDYRLDVLNPFQQAAQGFSQGTQIAANQEEIRQSRAEEARKQQKFIAQQQQQKDTYEFSLIPNKTHDDFVNFTTKYPQVTEAYQKSWEMLDAGQRQDSLSTAAQVMAAIKTGNTTIAQNILEDQAKAYENSGKKESAFNMRRMSGLITKDPNSIYTSLGLFGSAVSPDQFATMMDKMGSNVRDDELQPIAVNQANANVSKTTAETGKITAETEDIPLAAQDRQQGVVNQGNKIEYDNQYNYDKLSQDNVQFFEGLNNQQKIEANKLKAAKVESSTQKMERLEKAQNFSGAAVNAASTAKLAAELINDYKKLSDASGAGIWNAAMRNVPGTAEYNFSKRVDTLKSQAFLIGAQNLKGLGAMTEMEGKKVTDALGNLDLNQSTKQVAEQLAAIARAANSVAQNSNKNAQIYATKGQGYSLGVREAAKQLGISEAEAQKFANESGL